MRESQEKLPDLPRGWAYAKIGEICNLVNGRAFKAEDWSSCGLPIIRIQNLNDSKSSFNYYTGEVSEKNTINNGDLLFSWSGSRGTSFGAHIWRGQRAVLNQHIFKVGFDESRATKMYLLHALNKAVSEVEENLHGGVGLVHITKGNLEKIKIPLPLLEVQKEIVAEIEGYQKVIDGARAVVDNYRPNISIQPEWRMCSLSDISVRITKGSSPNWQGINYCNKENGILFITSENIGLGTLLLESSKYVESRFNDIEKKSILQKGDVLTNIVGASIGRTAIFNLDVTANINQAVCLIRPRAELVNSIFLMMILNSPSFIEKLLGNSVENARANVSMGVLGKLTIPIPPLETQRAIVAEIEAEQALVNANRELIVRFEKKIQATLARIWGEEEKN